jgi:hypothetical protein
MSASKILDGLSIKTPCSASWEEMRGNDQVRFCEHCNISVTDLSRMTPQAAIKLALWSKGRLCLRIHRDPAGEIITRSTRPEKLYAISRRASRIAAGAFTAVMGLSTAAYAQSSSSSVQQADRPVATASLASKAAGDNLWLHGTVTDANGAVIPAANVTIRNERTNETRQTTSDPDGAFGAWVSDYDNYEVTVEAKFFVKATIQHLTPGRLAEGAVDAALNPAESEMGGAMFTIQYAQPLVKAAFVDDAAQVAQLLREGADADRAEEDGTTALDLAVAHGNLAMAQLLLRSGASAGRTTGYGTTALFWLNQGSEQEMLALLLRAGADINHRANDGNTVLINAALGGEEEIIRALIDAGALVNLQNFEGDTALMVAANNDNRETVKVLLAAGANIRLRNVHGQDAMQIAEANENEEICALLEAAGAVRTVKRDPPAPEAADEDQPSNQ